MNQKMSSALVSMDRLKGLCSSSKSKVTKEGK